MTETEPSQSSTLRDIERRRRRATRLKAGVLLLAAGAAAAAYLHFGREPRPTPQPATTAEGVRPPEIAPVIPDGVPVAEPPTAALPAAAPPPPLPPLEASDALVREAVAALSSRAELAAWLVTDDLLRRFVAAVDNTAQGETPREQLRFLAPARRFRVLQRDEALFSDPRNHARYDRLARVFTSIDAGGAARLYHRLHPLIDRAYSDLGYPGRSFDEVLENAFRELLATPEPGAAPELRPRVISYAYADEELEGLSPVQKQLLRTGPANRRAIQAQLRELATALQLSEELR